MIDYNFNDIFRSIQSPAVRVLSPGNQVDRLPGAMHSELSSVGRVIRKLSRAPKGSGAQRLSVTRTMLALADWKSNTEAMLFSPSRAQHFFMKMMTLD